MAAKRRLPVAPGWYCIKYKYVTTIAIVRIGYGADGNLVVDEFGHGDGMYLNSAYMESFFRGVEAWVELDECELIDSMETC